jgi:peptidoglycan/LPS O-acetylase OafA/YrhL
LPELDSIRGVASLTVVFLHFHDMWMPDNPASLASWQSGLLTLLKPFYSGGEAVILFFVLSGLVLSMPYLKGKGQPYPKYLARRILRIYGPYLAALALALCGVAIWHGHASHGAWSNISWTQPISPLLVLQHVLFVGVYNNHEYDFVIWSLIQEMRISIIFPFLFLLSARIGAKLSVFLAIVLSATALAVVPSFPDLSARYNLVITLHYMAFFIAGILLASRLDKIKLWWAKTSSVTHWAIAIASFTAYAYDMAFSLRLVKLVLHSTSVTPSTGSIVANWFSCLGAIGLIIVALNGRPAKRLLTTAPAHFLGRISYSLYLVHPTVLLALTYACGDRISMWIQFPVYVTLALVIGWLFCKIVEEPFIKLSRSV